MTTVTGTIDDRAADTIRRRRTDLVALSRSIHELAELAFDEEESVAAILPVLEQAGFTVETGAGGLRTAFTATRGTGAVVVGICAEYDALPEIGHACGHNLIATSAIGAALGLGEVADELGITVKLIGTPAEEHGGGKVLLLEAGTFDDLTFAMMIHPAHMEGYVADGVSQGVGRYVVRFRGKGSHAAAAPQHGVNAADAAVVAQVAVGLLRQQLATTARVGLFVREGGRATNIIPDEVMVDFEVREFELEAQQTLHEKVVRCFEAGALATGCTLEIEPTEPEYEPLAQDPRLAEAFAAAMAGLGRAAEPNQPAGGSTDMGNVTQHLPGIHPMVGVRGSEHPPHTHGFATDVISPASEDTLIDGALAMAFTAVAVVQDAEVLAELRAEQDRRPTYAERGAR